MVRMLLKAESRSERPEDKDDGMLFIKGGVSPLLTCVFVMP